MSSDLEKTSKYRLGYTQSVNGIISFSGSVHFDDINTQEYELNCLLGTLQKAERKFKNLGYQIAKENEPKAKAAK
jgi:hypothetical protein